MASSSLLRERSKALPKLLSRLSLLRPMGGGPRTFPGGLNKWQYKRMHEKMARQKERRLLQQEKQLYQARLRSEIRAKLSGKASRDAADSSSSSIGGYGPMSSKDHIKALADRFMKQGAEDLWNEDDGPIRSAPQKRPTDPAPPIDLRKLVIDRRNLMEDRVGESRSSLASFDQRRQYSIAAGRKLRPGSKPRWKQNSSSEEDSDSESGFNLEGDATKMYRETKLGVKKHSRFSRFSIRSEEDFEEELDEVGGRIARKKMMSGAALGNYDVKTERRVPRPVEERGNFAKEIEEIRCELRNRDSYRNDARHHGAQEETLLTKTRFDECSISPLTIRALADARYVQMTVVQEAALPVCLEGKDALVKAKTGTGKSVAFLLPAIEAVLKATTNTLNQRVLPINVLVLCPTRELAIQIAAETNVLLKYHDGIGVQTLIGGTRFKLDQKRLDSNPCQIIVATPGRLLDHIDNKSGFSARLMGLKLLILDEADHLLDLGFRKDIEKIVDSVPRQRQSLLFSATIPKEVRRVSQLVLKKDHVFVDTVGLAGVDTPIKVLQSCFVASHELHFHLVYHLLKEHIMHEPDYKVIVFCTTAMVTAFMYVLLRDLKMNVREMHSRKPQLYRSRISEEFRESKNIILVTSDVSARGVNYPDVTLVIQVGIPSAREQYIHRLGRTGRVGKAGKGILLLAPWEEYFMDDVNGLPIEKSQLPELDLDMKQKVEDSIEKIDPSIKEAAYHAWLGYYNSIHEIGRDKTMLADLANRFCHSIGIDKPPALFRKTALKMGLKGIAGIRIRK
ncbi:DEAD-box ATP-dependent RNA helicase 48 [Cocos nucifera]|uniref:ATP-dependent RNA helicase n=1 Tax=Cocos nucifera TaxID=13894 RepID=A0A8K0N7L0_COCNU|nr:DEAD-box ATP-dependent RNA helicase 48 [Cocos nucifera]